MTVAASHSRTEAGIRARQISKKLAEVRRAAVDDASRQIARIERIACQEGIGNQVAAMMEKAANRIARDRGESSSYRTVERRLCRVFRVTPDQISGRSRKTNSLTLARQAIMYWAARLTGLSPAEIGKRMGGRDHSTVYFGIDRYPEKRAKAGRTLAALPREAAPAWLRRRGEQNTNTVGSGRA